MNDHRLQDLMMIANQPLWGRFCQATGSTNFFRRKILGTIYRQQIHTVEQLIGLQLLTFLKVAKIISEGSWKNIMAKALMAKSCKA
jgi:hypothetical protein